MTAGEMMATIRSITTPGIPGLGTPQVTGVVMLEAWWKILQIGTQETLDHILMTLAQKMATIQIGWGMLMTGIACQGIVTETVCQGRISRIAYPGLI